MNSDKMSLYMVLFVGLVGVIGIVSMLIGTSNQSDFELDEQSHFESNDLLGMAIVGVSSSNPSSNSVANPAYSIDSSSTTYAELRYPDRINLQCPTGFTTYGTSGKICQDNSERQITGWEIIPYSELSSVTSIVVTAGDLNKGCSNSRLISSKSYTFKYFSDRSESMNNYCNLSTFYRIYYTDDNVITSNTEWDYAATCTLTNQKVKNCTKQFNEPVLVKHILIARDSADTRRPDPVIYNVDINGQIASAPKICGDGIVQQPNDAGMIEKCDGSVSATCHTLGYVDGTLSCTSDCKLDISMCTNPSSNPNNVTFSDLYYHYTSESTKSITVSKSLTQTISYQGTDYSIEVLGGNWDDSSVIVRINGDTRTLTKGDRKLMSGLPVYVKEIFFTNIGTTDVGAYLIIGGDYLTMYMTNNGPYAVNLHNYNLYYMNNFGFGIYSIDVPQNSEILPSGSSIKLTILGWNLSYEYDAPGYNYITLFNGCSLNMISALGLLPSGKDYLPVYPTDVYSMNYNLVTSCEYIDPICTDSDGGLDYYTVGTANGILSVSKFGTPSDLQDYCFCEGGACTDNSLNEMACVDGFVTQNKYTCPNGCSNGACLSAPEDAILPDRTTFQAPIPNIDNAIINSATNSVEIAFRNNKGVSITFPLSTALIAGAGVTCNNSVMSGTYNGAPILPDVTQIPSGANFLLKWDCDDLNPAPIFGDKFSAEILFYYTNLETGQSLLHTGSVYGKYNQDLTIY